MDEHPTPPAFRLMDLPSEMIYAVGVAAEIKDTIALSATCRRLRGKLASLVWFRVKLCINDYNGPHYILTLNPYLKEHRKTLSLIKEATITSGGSGLLQHPYLVQSRTEDATFACTIRAMTSLRSLSLDVKGLSDMQIALLISELRTGPSINLQCLELRSKKNCGPLVECFGASIKALFLPAGPDSDGFKAASTAFRHLEILCIEKPVVIEGTRALPSIDETVIPQIAEAFPRLKSLVFRQTRSNVGYLLAPRLKTDEIHQTDSAMLRNVLNGKEPILQWFRPTMHPTIPLNPDNLVHFLSRFKAFISLATRDRPALNEVIIILGRTHLVRWERDGNWLSFREFYRLSLFNPVFGLAEGMCETRLVEKIPLDSDGELRATA